MLLFSFFELRPCFYRISCIRAWYTSSILEPTLDSCPRGVLRECENLFPVSEEEEGHEGFHGHSEEAINSLSLRVERLPRREPVALAFKSWMGEGLAVHRGNIFHAINRLRKLKMNKRALEVMEWLMRERPYKLKELDYSYLIEFTSKVHGISQAESLFLRVPQEYQNELLYNNLVMACLEKGLIRLSLAYLRKMRLLSFPISPYVYNRLIILHVSRGRRKIIPKILSLMKSHGVPRHTSTYNILLKLEADSHDIEGLSKVFEEMKLLKVEPNEITHGILGLAHAVARLFMVSEMHVEAIENIKSGKNWSTFDILLLLYGHLGKRKDLERTWKIVQTLPRVRSNSFLLAVGAFGRIGLVDRAEEIFSAMKSKRSLNSTKHFNALISVYCRHGLVEKAARVLREMTENGCKPNAITYLHLALGCLKAGLTKEALSSLEMCRNQVVSFRVRRSIPWLETNHSLLDGFAETGDVDNANKIFDVLKESGYCRYTFVCNSLLKAYVKSRVHHPNLLREMILGGARPDDETYSLVKVIEQFKSEGS